MTCLLNVALHYLIVRSCCCLQQYRHWILISRPVYAQTCQPPSFTFSQSYTSPSSLDSSPLSGGRAALSVHSFALSCPSFTKDKRVDRWLGALGQCLDESQLITIATHSSHSRSYNRCWRFWTHDREYLEPGPFREQLSPDLTVLAKVVIAGVCTATSSSSHPRRPIHRPLRAHCTSSPLQISWLLLHLDHSSPAPITIGACPCRF